MFFSGGLSTESASALAEALSEFLRLPQQKRAEERPVFGVLLDLREARLPNELGQRLVRLPEVCDVQPSAGSQYAGRLGECQTLVLFREVVKHHARKHSVE